MRHRVRCQTACRRGIAAQAGQRLASGLVVENKRGCVAYDRGYRAAIVFVKENESRGVLPEHFSDSGDGVIGGSFEQLDHRPDLAEPGLVGRDSIYDVAFEDVVGPPAELGGDLRFDAVAYRNDEV
jgi:hypothetical protein